MTDVLTPRQRSKCMSAIKGKNTRPEMMVRSLIHGMGYRFRLHQANLPGKPDIVLKKCKKVVFVHGCFWHVHRCRFGRVIPATNRIFWRDKRSSNVARDRYCHKSLRALGWKIFVVWECWLKKSPTSVEDKLKKFLAG